MGHRNTVREPLPSPQGPLGNHQGSQNEAKPRLMPAADKPPPSAQEAGSPLGCPGPQSSPGHSCSHS